MAVEQNRLNNFVEKYNRNTLEEIKSVRALIGETNSALQKQISHSIGNIENLLPRAEVLENQMQAARDKLEKLSQL